MFNNPISNDFSPTGRRGLFKIDYLILILVCLGIRIIHINTFDLWVDEIYNFFHINSFYLSVRKTPLYILVNLVYKSFFPESVLYAHNYMPRVPALIFGVATVLTLYDGFKRFRGPVPGLIMAIVSCASYPLIIYSKESRFYSMTHFFTATALWFFLAILDTPSRKRIIGLTVTAVLGFLTYPYLTFCITFIYLILYARMFFQTEKGPGTELVVSFASYLVITIPLMLLMRKSFSSAAYSPLGFSTSFFFYSVKSTISYFSGNSYLLAVVSFIFPFVNAFGYFKKKEPVDCIYIWWLLCCTLIIAHVFIITFLTVNAFNPRHLSFLVIPFLAAITSATHEIFRAGKRYVRMDRRLYAALFLALMAVFILTRRDFVEYLKTGQNHHAINRKEISENLRFIKKVTGDDGAFRLFFVHAGKLNDYPFYRYRSQERIVDICRYHDILKGQNLPEALRLGFVYTDPQFGRKMDAIPNKAWTGFYIYHQPDMQIVISKQQYSRTQIDHFAKRIKDLFLLKDMAGEGCR